MDFDNKVDLGTKQDWVNYTPTKNGIIVVSGAWNGVQGCGIKDLDSDMALFNSITSSSFIAGNVIVNKGRIYTYYGNSCWFIPFK